MKAILEFNLEESFDREAHIRAIKATDAYLALYDIENLLKRNEEYPAQEVLYEVYSKLKEQFYNILQHRDINLDKELS